MHERSRLRLAALRLRRPAQRRTSAAAALRSSCLHWAAPTGMLRAALAWPGPRRALAPLQCSQKALALLVVWLI